MIVNPIDSDIPPVKEESNPARQAWLDTMKSDTAALEAKTEALQIEREKHVFHIFDTVKFPTFEAFCPETEKSRQDHSVGYGGPAVREAFKPALCAQWIKENLAFTTDINTGILYFYNGKHWIPNAEPYLERAVCLSLGDENKRSHYENIAHDLRALTYNAVTFSHKVSCENGLIDVATGEFTEFTPEETPLHAIPTYYDATATCPNFEEFVKQSVAPDDVATLQEWSGYCLLPNYSYHKILWVVGSGRNGKGVWQRTIEGILGAENVANVGIEEFDGAHRFSLYQLHGKLVNFCSEPRTTRELQTNLLKYATGQDTLEAEIKGKQKRLSFRNTAKITVLANKFPRCNDQTTAFKERRLFLKFPNEFLGKDQIADLEQIWLNNPAEKSGILNWMLKGLHRLLSNGMFTTSRTQDEAELEYLRASDSASAFIRECATFDKHLIATRADTQEAYTAYCDYHSLDAENERKICAKLKETPHVKNSNTRVSGKLERAWIGISFKKLCDESEGLAESEAKQATLEVKPSESDTDDTDDTHGNTPLDILKPSQIVGEIKTPVSSVSCVSESQATRCLDVASILKVCGNCENHMEPSCVYPGDFESVAKENSWAYNCSGFKLKAVNPGEMSFNVCNPSLS